MKKIFGAALLLIICAVAYAEIPLSVYKPGTAYLYRSGISVIDSAAIDGANNKALPFIDASYNQIVRVDLRMSNAAATCKIHFVRANGSEGAEWQQPISKTSATATADATFTIGGKYAADSIAFDTGSFKYFKVLVEAPSAGSVDVWVTICGGKS